MNSFAVRSSRVSSSRSSSPSPRKQVFAPVPSHASVVARSRVSSSSSGSSIHPRGINQPINRSGPATRGPTLSHSRRNKSKRRDFVRRSFLQCAPPGGVVFPREFLGVRSKNERRIIIQENQRGVKKRPVEIFFGSSRVVEFSGLDWTCLVCVNSVDGNTFHMCKQYETLWVWRGPRGVVRLSVRVALIRMAALRVGGKRRGNERTGRRRPRVYLFIYLITPRSVRGGGKRIRSWVRGRRRDAVRS